MSGEYFIEMVREFSKIDPEKAPNFVTVKTLFKKYVEAGFSEFEAAKIVGNFNIDVNDEFVEKYLEETADIYVALTLKMKIAAEKISPVLFQEYMKSNQFALKYQL